MKRNICFFFGILTCFMMLLWGAEEAKAEADVNTLTKEQTERMDKLEISLLTCTPHDEVYSLYGHTAIRVKDPVADEDYVVNYGVFDTRVNMFVLRFIFGLTDYTMEAFDWKLFEKEYRHFGCGIYEQRMNMSAKEKVQFLLALQENAREENKVYRYNYFYNNCTTKARDILLGAFDGVGEPTQKTSWQRGEVSFRQLVHLGNDDYPWTMAGNDLLLGVGSDANTNYEEREFLPRVLAADLDSTRIVYADGTSKPAVSKAEWVVEPGKKWQNPDMPTFPLTPTACALIFFALVVMMVMMECLVLKKELLYVHYGIYCLYASVGVLLFLMLFSQHPTVRVNLQILMFNPLFFIFALPKVMKKWGRYAILVCLVMFLVGNTLQTYAEGANVMAFALLTTFLPYLFCRVKKK